MLVHLIADFGQYDLAFAEVAQRLKCHLPDAELLMSSVPPFSTLAAGFCVAQLGLNAAPPGTVIFHNVAPRRDDGGARRDNDGERLAYARLPGGVEVVGVNAGYAFSFVRELASDLAFVRVPSAGSQFRSRDLFPAAFAAVLKRREGALAEALEPEQVPEVPPRRVAYVDGFGNLKTTLKHDEVAPGSSWRVTLAGVSREVTVGDSSFSVAQGQLSFAPGSSGWALPGGGRVRWMELFLRGGSAWDAFGRPPVGAELGLERLG